MKRREFITLLGVSGSVPARGACAAASHAGDRVPWPGSPETDAALESGHCERVLRKLASSRVRVSRLNFAGRTAEYEQLPTLATDLVHRHVNVIAATSTPAALGCKGSDRYHTDRLRAGGRPG